MKALRPPISRRFYPKIRCRFSRPSDLNSVGQFKPEGGTPHPHFLRPSSRDSTQYYTHLSIWGPDSPSPFNFITEDCGSPSTISPSEKPFIT
ncbi:hypothetical protein QVD99_000085 [Batrachochytrium dendrobatidis]|nr:hypothetical protein O5D80_008632 [Batrachochytrium dendrobatidis]KAK5664436.1 hypothetical protein QVD99_000085 [Batrachochytrium dendrobatidis]